MAIANIDEASARLTPEGRVILLRVLSRPAFTGFISAADAAALERAEGKTTAELMLDLLPAAKMFAGPAISKFRVGAIVRGGSGNLYLGANLELAGQPLGFTVHAEQAASANAFMHEEPRIEDIAVTAAPCGHCRQFLQELSPAGDLTVLVRGLPARRLAELLPAAFGPEDLGLTGGALPVSRQSIAAPRDVDDPTTAAALSAAGISYAPYTKAYSGVAIRCSDGSLHTGSYIENAAFNPSLPPLEAALISFIMASRDFAEIAKVVLVELENAPISQKWAVESAVRSIRPDINLQIVTGRLLA